MPQNVQIADNVASLGFIYGIIFENGVQQIFGYKLRLDIRAAVSLN